MVGPGRGCINGCARANCGAGVHRRLAPELVSSVIVNNALGPTVIGPCRGCIDRRPRANRSTGVRWRSTRGNIWLTSGSHVCLCVEYPASSVVNADWLGTLGDRNVGARFRRRRPRASPATMSWASLACGTLLRTPRVRLGASARSRFSRGNDQHAKQSGQGGLKDTVLHHSSLQGTCTPGSFPPGSQPTATGSLAATARPRNPMNLGYRWRPRAREDRCRRAMRSFCYGRR